MWPRSLVLPWGGLSHLLLHAWELLGALPRVPLREAPGERGGDPEDVLLRGCGLLGTRTALGDTRGAPAPIYAERSGDKRSSRVTPAVP